MVYQVSRSHNVFKKFNDLVSAVILIFEFLFNIIH